jgi:hypothetical protein
MHAIFFVVTLALTWMVGFFVVCSASHVFITILESSTIPYIRNVMADPRDPLRGRQPSITWSREFFSEYFIQGFYLAFHLTLWLGPSVALGYLIAGNSPYAAMICGGVFALLFPFGLLSSLVTESRWNPVSLKVFACLFRRPLKTLAFIALSIPITIGFFLSFDALLIRTNQAPQVWMVGLSVACSLLFFLYARLIGRLGLVLAHAWPQDEETGDDEPKRRAKPKRPAPAKVQARIDAQTRWSLPKADVDQSSTETPLQTPEGEVSGYGLFTANSKVEEKAKPKRVVHLFDDEDDEPLSAAPPPEIREERVQVARKIATPSQRELSMYLRERPEEPKNPFGVELVSFLFEAETFAVWFVLTLQFFALGFLQRILDSARP